MINDITIWFDSETRPDEDFHTYLSSREEERKNILRKVYTDLVILARSLGQTPAQARGVVESLFRTFTAEVFLYTFLGTDDLAVAITEDTTLAWLNFDVAGTPIRQRLVNRLS